MLNRGDRSRSTSRRRSSHRSYRRRDHGSSQSTSSDSRRKHRELDRRRNSQHYRYTSHSRSPYCRSDSERHWRRHRRSRSSSYKDEQNSLRHDVRRRRHYRREVATSSNKKPERCTTTVIAVSEVLSGVTEDEVETAVRTTAISLGFSPPNFVKFIPVVANENTNNSTTTALVDFPSTDSAQVFLDTCSNNFALGGKRVHLSPAPLPPGMLSAAASGQSAIDWSYLISCLHGNNQNNLKKEVLTEENNKALSVPGNSNSSASNNNKILGPELPCPNLDEFTFDRKTGLRYYEALQIYYDSQSQQYMSGSGTYYVKGGTSPNKPCLIPIYRIPGSTDSSLAAIAAIIDNKQPEGAPQESSLNEPINTNTVSVPISNPAATKATAVASVLAAAQIAAKAMKKAGGCRNKNDVVADLSNTNGHNKTSNNGDGGKALRVTPIDESQPQSIQAIFVHGDDDDALQDDEDELPVPQETSDSVGLVHNTETVASAVVDDDEEETALICYVCLRQFDNLGKLRTHESFSKFHKKNCELQGIERPTA